MITWCYNCSDWNNNQVIMKHMGIEKIDFEMIKLWNNWILNYSTWNCSWMILCVYGWWFKYLQHYLEIFTAHNFKSCWVKKFSKKNWSICNIIGLSHLEILTSLILFCWSIWTAQYFSQELNYWQSYRDQDKSEVFWFPPPIICPAHQVNQLN